MLCDVRMGQSEHFQNRDCSEGNVFIDNDDSKITRAIVKTKYDKNIETCRLLLETKDHYRIRAIINYFPQTLSDCQTEYIHIGSDKHRINKISMTSYKFCDETVSEEIVSRKNFMWIVYTLTNNTAVLRIEVSAHREVACESGQFECSPVQCLAAGNICDGIAQCDNGRDEYCVWNSDTADSVDEPCFQCLDGSCIRPTLSRYHDNWGKPLWYLCDGFRHCKDAMDERPDVCNRSQGRQDKVIQCRPEGNPGITKILWKADISCSEKDDCKLLQEEQLCSSEGATDDEHGLFVPVLIVAIAVTAIAIAFCVIHKMILLREKGPLRNNVPLYQETSSADTQDKTNASQRRTSALETQQEGRSSIRRSNYMFNLCHGGRPSLETMPVEKQCFISSV